MLEIPHLHTQRLLLRGFQESDLDGYAEMCADPEVMQYIGTGQTLNRSEAWRNMAMMLGHWHLRGYGMWAVEERSTGEMIGRVGCLQPEGWPGFEIGWSLRRSFWGQGFATEAAQAAVQYAFETLQQPHVNSLIIPENMASRRVAEKLGETWQGTIEILGLEVLQYRLQRDTWEQNRRSAE